MGWARDCDAAAAEHIRVLITERTPVAFVRQGTQIGLVDASGVLLDMPPESAGDPNYSFPVLTGISASDPLSTREARMEIYRKFAHDLDSTGQHFFADGERGGCLESGGCEGAGGIGRNGYSGALSASRTFCSGLSGVEQHLPEWKQQYPKLASADMR